jgi:hypothetical protein
VYDTTPSTARDALRDTQAQHNALSLEATATGVNKTSSKGEEGSTAWSNLLTTADLDEGGGQLGAPGQEAAISGGVGTLMAAAGQMPGWAQASVRGLHQQQDAQQQQQQQQGKQQDTLSTAGLFSKDQSAWRARVSPAAAAAAGELAMLATAAGSNTPSVTATMLDSVDDTEGLLQHSMQALLHTLSPIEQRILSILYGLQEDHAAGLGVDLPPADFVMASSSTSSSSSSGSGSGSGRTKSQGGVSSAGGQRYPHKLAATVKFSRNSVSLQEAGKQLGLHYNCVAIIRNMALGKLAAAAKAAARNHPQGPTQAGAAGQGGSSVAAAVSGLPGSNGDNSAAHLLSLIPLLQQFVAEHGRVPIADEEYQGKRLARYVSRLRTRYWQGRLAPLAEQTLLEAVPIWTWGERPTGKRKPAKARKAAAAAAAAAAAGAEQGSQQRSSMSKAAAILQAIRSKASRKKKGGRPRKAVAAAGAADLQASPKKLGRPRKAAVAAAATAATAAATQAAAGAEQGSRQENSAGLLNAAAAAAAAPTIGHTGESGRRRQVPMAADAYETVAGDEQGSQQLATAAARVLGPRHNKRRPGRPRKAAVTA